MTTRRGFLALAGLAPIAVVSAPAPAAVVMPAAEWRPRKGEVWTVRGEHRTLNGWLIEGPPGEWTFEPTEEYRMSEYWQGAS